MIRIFFTLLSSIMLFFQSSSIVQRSFFGLQLGQAYDLSQVVNIVIGKNHSTPKIVKEYYSTKIIPLEKVKFADYYWTTALTFNSRYQLFDIRFVRTEYTKKDADELYYFLYNALTKKYGNSSMIKGTHYWHDEDTAACLTIMTETTGGLLRYTIGIQYYDFILAEEAYSYVSPDL